ncbi:E3 ubiquitin-protein ligase BOI-like isoform X1 [Cynara cardunculus var. scolymus]|uniref:E3 ubiquitin-protein ligase BOI-like isoform X1 n=1 Tax=Cynara cardunculus var. scolymus TaxID=59895 RepID=UPI000D62E38B|nr:E3 ubiquitin-protein ligase BOI-like isoform X1 [Cynara cardunculus var. scolymus]XP_024988132.1 E3 ubiquitin-protein ligase BOI-like isoform X1 [Cynara cardunculus var. scolymus]
MFGGSNTNSLVPVFLDENLFQYPSNQLQLFGNVPATRNVDPVNYSVREHNSPVFRSNKRPREAEANLMQKKLQISLNQNFYNEETDRPSTIPTPHPVSTGLKLSYDDEERNSSITSASGSMTAAPSIMSSFGDGVTNELDRHNEELERFIMIQGENMVKGVKEIRQRHMATFLASIGKGIEKKIREKDLEIETINLKNKDLVGRIKQVANEAQNWHYRAKYNESMVNMLRTNLQQALAQGNEQQQQVKEGFGDTDVEYDAVSSIDPNNYLNAPGKSLKDNNSSMMVCKACKAKEVSVLVMPCRHLSLCKDCDRGVNVCPVCQIVKTVGVEVYMS